VSYKHGDTNGLCMRCGFKHLLSDMRKEWTGLIVCRQCWEPRHPQDFVRAVPDVQAPRRQPSPEPADVFLTANQVTVDDL
jgi:hypothetical protein